MPPKAAERWDRKSGIHPSFFAWPPPAVLQPWESVRAAEYLIRTECTIDDMAVCLLYNKLEAGELPVSWLRETYPAVHAQCVAYAEEMAEVERERDRLAAEYCKSLHGDGHTRKKPRGDQMPDTAAPRSVAENAGSASSKDAPIARALHGKTKHHPTGAKKPKPTD